MSVLCILAESPNSVVSKEKLIEEVWGERIVSEEVLTNAISVLRKHFNDRAKSPRFIETIPKKGYRLLLLPSPVAPNDNFSFNKFILLNKTRLKKIFLFLFTLMLPVLLINNKNLLSLNPTIPIDSLQSLNVWNFQTGGNIPALGFEQNGSYYFYSEDGFVYSVNLLDGKENWRIRIGRNNIQQIILLDGFIFVLSNEGGLYAIDTMNGEEVWRRPFSDLNKYSLLNTIGEHEILWANNNVLSIINTQSGNNIREYIFKTDINFVIKVTESKVLIGDIENNLIFYSLSDSNVIWRKKLKDELWNLPVFDNNSIVLPFRNELVVIDRYSGKQNWKENTGDWAYQPIIAPGKVINITGEGKVTAFNINNGNKLWMKQIESAPKTSTVFENHVLISTDDKSILLFNLDSGNLVNRKTVSIIVSKMTVIQGTDKTCLIDNKVDLLTASECIPNQYSLMIGSTDGSLHKANLYFQNGNVDILMNQSLIRPELTNNTKQVTFHSFGDMPVPKLYWEISTFGVPGDATLSGDIIYYSDARYLYKSNLVSKELIWRKSLYGAIGTRIILVDRNIIIGSRDGNLYYIDSATGDTIWSFSTKSSIISTPFAKNGVVYFGSQDDYFYALALKDGALKWHYKTGDNINGSSSYDNKSVYFGSGDKHIYSLDLENGRLNWRYNIGEWSVDGLLVDNKTVYAGSHDGKLVALNVIDGSLNWEFKTEGYIWYQKSIDEENIYVGSSDQFVYAIDKMTGTEKWRFKTDGRANYSNLLLDNLLYFTSEDGNLYAVNAKTRKKQWVMNTTGKLHNISGNYKWLVVPSTNFELLVIQLLSQEP